MPDKPMKDKVVLTYDKPANPATVSNLRPNLYYLTDKDHQIIPELGPFKTLGKLIWL